MQTRRATLPETPLKDRLNSVQDRNARDRAAQRWAGPGVRVVALQQARAYEEPHKKSAERPRRCRYHRLPPACFAQPGGQSISTGAGGIVVPNGRQRLDMLRLRSSPNKRTEACEIVNRFKKKMNDKRACNIGNLR